MQLIFYPNSINNYDFKVNLIALKTESHLIVSLDQITIAFPHYASRRSTGDAFPTR